MGVEWILFSLCMQHLLAVAILAQNAPGIGRHQSSTVFSCRLRPIRKKPLTIGSLTRDILGSWEDHKTVLRARH